MTNFTNLAELRAYKAKAMSFIQAANTWTNEKGDRPKRIRMVDRVRRHWVHICGRYWGSPSDPERVCSLKGDAD